MYAVDKKWIQTPILTDLSCETRTKRSGKVYRGRNLDHPLTYRDINYHRNVTEHNRHSLEHETHCILLQTSTRETDEEQLFKEINLLP